MSCRVWFSILLKMEVTLTPEQCGQRIFMYALGCFKIGVGFSSIGHIMLSMYVILKFEGMMVCWLVYDSVLGHCSGCGSPSLQWHQCPAIDSFVCSAMGKPNQAKTGKGKGKRGEARPPQLQKRVKAEHDGAPPPKVSKASFGENADINVKVQAWMGAILKNPIMGDKDHDIRNASPLEVSEGGKQSPLVVEDFDKALEGAEAGSKDGFYNEVPNVCIF